MISCYINTNAHFCTHTHKERKKKRKRETEQTKRSSDQRNKKNSSWNTPTCERACVCVCWLLAHLIHSFISSYLIEVIRLDRIHSIGNCVSVYIDKNNNNDDSIEHLLLIHSSHKYRSTNVNCRKRKKKKRELNQFFFEIVSQLCL